MIRALSILCLLVASLAAAPQSTDLGAGSRPDASGTAVLRIDGDEISSDEYARWLLDNFAVSQAKVFAGDYLIEREARRRGIELQPGELARELDSELAARIEGAFLGSREGWLAELERTQRSEAGLRTQRTQALGIELLTRKLVAQDRVVPEEKILREWELSYGRGGRAWQLSMLLVRCEFLTPDAKASPQSKEAQRQEELDVKRARALALRQRIVDGADFAAVARESSDDPSTRANGGRPVPAFRHYGWPNSFLDSLERLSQGEISEPIYAKGGWWIVRVDGVTLTPLEQVRPELLARLVQRGPEQDETGNFRNALVAAARIELLPTLFGAAPTDSERPELVPALSIDGEPVARSSYAMWILRTRGEASWPHFVEHRVVINEARRRGVEASEADVRARAQDWLRQMILQDHKGSRDSWLTQLKLRGQQEHLFVHDVEVRMRIELLCERLILLDRVITPEQVRTRFNEVYGENGNLIQARLILVNVPIPGGQPDEPREQVEERITKSKEETRARVQALVQLVRDGGDFATLARQHSQDSASAARGGMLDTRFRPDRWPAALAKSVEALEVGGVTDAFEFGPSFVALQVVERRKIEFAAVEADLTEQMQNEPPARPDLNLYRNSLVRRSKVEILEGMNP